MKKGIIFLLIISAVLLILFSDCKKESSVKIKKPEPVQTNQELELNNYIYKIEKKTIGIDKSMKEMTGIESEIFSYSVIVRSKENSGIIQEIKFEDETDLLMSIERDSGILDNLIKVKFKWNKFTTSPIGYRGFRFFSVSENDGKLTPMFCYFEHAGEQDYPYADLDKLNKTGDNLELNYHYFESIGIPEYGEGEIKLIYLVDRIGRKITFDKIESSVYKNESPNNSASGTASGTDKKILLKFTKDELNSKFRYLLNRYSFAY
jgi:hypothetical protein